MHRSITTALVKRLTEYAEQPPEGEADEFVIPDAEGLAGLGDEELSSLSEQATEHFDALYGDGTGLSTEDLAALATLTEGIETLNAEVAKRAEDQAQREEQAREMAARVRPSEAPADESPADEAPAEGEELAGEGEEEAPAEEPKADEEQPQAVAASAQPAQRKDLRVNLSSVRSRAAAHQPTPTDYAKPKSIKDLLVMGDVPGFKSGTGVDWTDVGRAIDRRLASFNLTQYESAQRMGRHVREQNSVAFVRKPFEADMVATSNDPDHVEEVISRAVDQTRLPGNSLTAAGGWCAPSETVYDFLELESTDGLVSLPEIGISRGGIQWTLGPQFQDIYANTGFSYTEEQDIAGQYGTDEDGNGNDTDGDKPCYFVECPPFQEARLGVAGLCISAGLLQQRGYPEVISRTTRGALVAHEHKMSARLINAMVAGSDAVTMPATQAGTAAPILTTIELQVEHYRYVHRLSRNTTLEAIFPYWVRGAIRSDLSRRLGVEMLSVTDAQISAWFTARGISPQFVYNWQDITGDSSAFTEWPTEVSFLLYAAGTWVRGSADVITLDTIYDSVLLGQNNFTALFTEEGWLLMKRFTDSRVVTTSLQANGATHGGILIEHDGTVTPAA